MATVKGTNTPQLTRKRFNFDRNSGWSTEYQFEGLKDNVKQLAGRYTFEADNISLDEDGPTATMSVRIGRDATSPATPSAADITTTWEIIGQQVQRHVTENPNISAALTDSRDVAEIKSHAAQVQDATSRKTVATVLATTFESGNTYGTGTLNAGEKARRLLLYKLIANQETTVTSEYVLRKSQTVRTDYELAMSTAGVDMVWTLAKVSASENMPLQVAKTISGAAKGAVTTDTATGAILKGTSAQWNFGFLKQAPQITYTVGGQVERAQEWWLNYWLSTDYAVY